MTGQSLSLFIQYPNREPVLRELRQLPQNLAELRCNLEVLEDQQLQLQDAAGQYCQVEQAGQLFDGANLRVTVPRRRIFVSLEGSGHPRPIVWYPGSTSEQIESAIVKACGLPLGTPIELLEGDVAVVISATIPNDSRLVAVPLVSQTNGNSRHLERYASPDRGGVAPESPRRRGVAASTAFGSRPASAAAPSRGALSMSNAQGTAASSTGGRSVARAESSTNQRARSATPVGNSPPSRLGRRGETPGGSMTVPSHRPPSRGSSPGRNTAGPSGGADQSAQPAGKVSAPDEHCVHILAGHNGFVLSLCTVGDVLFTGSQDCNIMIWDLNNLQYIGTLPGHRGFVKCMAATLTNKMLCSGSQDKTIKLWSLETFSSTSTLYGHTSEVNTLMILEGTDMLISGGEDRSIRVWDLSNLSQLASLEQAHMSGIFTVKQLESGMFISASRDRTMKVWLASTWQARRTLSPPHYDGVSDVVVAQKTGSFFSASRDRSIRRWDVKSLESDLQLAHAQGDWLTALALAPSEKVLYSGGKDSIIKVWDSDLHCKDMLQGHRGPISQLLSIDSHLFSASHDRTVRVWKIDQFEH
eukprot:TRINITY_DN90625_c0_g1_i1.p1 TRINITY_DN90625_c0_g1~~TRINITY_DN90625_c0_g1_i1.p1  ORF type:complete len:584 (+),score=95.52 TRINITY_DN90625_c0_g1_i1:42-1793(+)